jgi:hypothetical protein
MAARHCFGVTSQAALPKTSLARRATLQLRHAAAAPRCRCHSRVQPLGETAPDDRLRCACDGAAALTAAGLGPALQNEAACSAALNTAALTMFATSVTTGASFLSNLVAYVAPVRLLGVFAACTVASCYVMTVRRPLGRAGLRSAPRVRMGARCAVPLRRATLALVQAAGTLLRCVRVCCMPLFCCVRRICCALQ